MNNVNNIYKSNIDIVFIIRETQIYEVISYHLVERTVDNIFYRTNRPNPIQDSIVQYTLISDIFNEE